MSMRRLWACAILGCAASPPNAMPAAGATDAAIDAARIDAALSDDGGAVPAPSRVLGVTITNPWVAGSGASGATLSARLRGLVGSSGRRPTARVVLDERIDRVFL